MLTRKFYQRDAIPQREASRRLGVTLAHLNRVLRGHRESRRLTRRYIELLKTVSR